MKMVKTMKEKILEILKEAKKALSLEEIIEKISISSASDIDALQMTLEALEKEVLIYHSNKDKYMLLKDSPLKRGVVRANKKGFVFVDVDDMDEDVYVNKSNVNGAIDDDVVLVEITSAKNIDKMEGRILKIIERSKDTYVGEINFKKDMGYITLDDKKINLQIEVSRKNSMNAVDGHKVLVKINSYYGENKARGEVVKIIGHKNDPGTDILSIAYKYEIEDAFSDEVVEQLKTLPSEVCEEDKKGRVDLTDEVIFTIDGDDTKDIDDAISIEKLENGNYKLGVHIADVSYYVKEGEPLDRDAMERGTSVYLVDRVIPMLPHELSNGICSLNPNVERLAISCVMEINQKGKVEKYDIFPSVIRSRIQMTYKKVNKFLEENEIVEGYEEFAPHLALMEELAVILRKMKEERGYINFDVDEAKILVDENCHPTEIIKRYRGKGEMLIEDFMIAANETVAEHIYHMNLPFIYRVHEYPKEERIRNYLNFVSSLGYQTVGNIKDVSPKTMQKILKSLEDKPEYKILASLLLRSMQKAVYRPENLGHYGLASKYYTHFTSPIRRYPDTTVHRLLHTYLFDHKLDRETIEHWQEKMPFVAEHSSMKERASVDCEREVEDMKMAEYMEDHVGEEFEGMITSVTNFGMFVELDNLVEGLVPIKDMDGFYHYDEVTMTLTNGKKKYHLGDRLVVKVVRASKEEKIIDFAIVKRV